jgi:single-strand DNA-binding protein
VAGSVNKVILVGNLGKDPEIRFTQAGLKMASFSLATSDSWKDKTTGERKDRTEWHRVVVMNDKIADVIEKYVKKGTKLFVEGQLQTRKYTDQQGIDRYVTEIVISTYRGGIELLDKLSNTTNTQTYDVSSQNDTQSAALPQQHSLDDLNDEIPF